MNAHAVCFVFCYLASLTLGLRFGHDSVSIDTEVIIVGRPARLTCNYVKYRTESVREISWYAGYTGFRSKIFHYVTSTGKKEGSVYPFIKTDLETATDLELTIILTEFRDANMTFACEVESMRDDGYGKLRHNKKLGETFVKVINTENHELVAKTDPTQGRSVTPGKPLSITCISRGADPPPRLSVTFAGKNITEFYGGRLEEAETGSPKDFGVIGSLQDVTEALIHNGFLTVECLAYYDDYLFAKKELRLEKKGGGDLYGYDRPTAQPNQWAGSVGSSAAAERRHRPDSFPDHVSPGFDRNGGSAGGERQGRVQEGYDADVIHTRLLDLVDPARHVHPGIPYDFFAGYVMMLSDNINPSSEGGAYDYVTLLGELPYDVETALQRQPSKVNKVSSVKTRVKLDAVKVLNMMGSMGYRVTGASHYGVDGFVWTLERRNFQNIGNTDRDRTGL